MEYSSISTPPSGSIRFNTDSKKMEIYNGDKWWEIDSTSPEVQTGGTRGIWFGGGDPGPSPGHDNTISYINVDTTGDATEFGDLSQTRANLGGSASSPTRGLFRGGQTPTKVNTIDSITILTTGNATDFGDTTSVRAQMAGCSDCHGGIGE